MTPSLDRVLRAPQAGQAYVARCRLGGYRGGPKRAAYWRALGWPNLKRATEARWRDHRARKQVEAARKFSPFADPKDFPWR